MLRGVFGLQGFCCTQGRLEVLVEPLHRRPRFVELGGKLCKAAAMLTGFGRAGPVLLLQFLLATAKAAY